MTTSPIHQRLRDLINEGERFTYNNFASKTIRGYPEAYAPEFITWRVRASSAIRKLFGADGQPTKVVDEALEIALIGYGEDNFKLMKGLMLGALHAALDADEGPQRSVGGTSIGTSGVTAFSNRVFIVHGHDDRSKAELEVILRDLGLEPIVLHRQPDEGRTIIEKFEHHSDVGYAFVILTPDDVAYKAQDDVLADGVRSKEWRARQNVVLELGFFLGKLGRSRVCCLYKAPVALPSDVSGVVYKSFEKSVEEVGYALIKELRAAGYEVNV